MDYYELDTSAGNHIDNVSAKALEIAKEKDVTVRFVFNEIACLVDKDTPLNLLSRDYMNAHLMEWKVIGPHYAEQYSPAVMSEMKIRIAARDERNRQSQQEYDDKIAKRQSDFEQKTKGLTLDLVDEQGYKDWKAKNTDGYGAAVFTYAKQWALLMQYEMSKGKALAEVAESTSFEADTVGLSGFQYGAAVSILSKCWRHGVALHEWETVKRA